MLLTSLTLLLWSLTTPAIAQSGNRRPGAERMEGRQERQDRVQEARRAFLAERMQLTTKEAAAFFPLYDAFQQEMGQARRKRFRNLKEESTGQTLTEAEARQLLDANLETEADQLAILRRSTAAYLQVIPATKLIKLEPAERAFRRELVDRFRSGRGGRPQGE